MGVLPLVFQQGDSIDSLEFDGSEVFFLEKIAEMKPRQHIVIKVVRADGSENTFEVISRLDTDIEVAYYMHGGILPYVLRQLMKAGE
jgi:aconitate hydratase